MEFIWCKLTKSSGNSYVIYDGKSEKKALEAFEKAKVEKEYESLCVEKCRALPYGYAVIETLKSDKKTQEIQYEVFDDGDDPIDVLDDENEAKMLYPDKTIEKWGIWYNADGTICERQNEVYYGIVR